MKKYEITAYIDEVKKSRIVEAENEKEAEKMSWELFDAEEIFYVFGGGENEICLQQ
jgi:hypothetical protein